jgi:hypothetical protein
MNLSLLPPPLLPSPYLSTLTRTPVPCRRIGVTVDSDTLRVYFNAMDSLGSKDGHVSVQELILGLSILEKGSYTDRLAFSHLVRSLVLTP